MDDVAGVQRYLATPSKHKRERRASYSDDSIGLLLQQVVQVVWKALPSPFVFVGMNACWTFTDSSHPTSFYNSPFQNFQNGRLGAMSYTNRKILLLSINLQI